jgi:hypothetical protein
MKIQTLNEETSKAQDPMEKKEKFYDIHHADNTFNALF